jgi:hypothetical protein
MDTQTVLEFQPTLHQKEQFDATIFSFPGGEIIQTPQLTPAEPIELGKLARAAFEQGHITTHEFVGFLKDRQTMIIEKRHNEAQLRINAVLHRS